MGLRGVGRQGSIALPHRPSHLEKDTKTLITSGAERMVVHRPHPGPEIGRATVRDIAAFLEAIGVRPT